uniref:Sugar phosphate transporter domain-containing protein n=1 Tax=Fagus sylvatica TaxID=28930 RepID=A0A2N9EXE2_FAGSY
MVEAQTWTTRRMSNPRLDTTATDQVLEIPATPPGDVRNNNAYSVGSYFSPTVSTALIIASWYLSNIGVLLSKYLLSFHGYRYPIFLTMLHMISCSAYSYASINFLDLVPLQHIYSKQYQNRFNRSGSRFVRSNHRFPVFVHFF